MSHQGYEGWFPECLVCGMGNLGGVVCLAPDHGDVHGLIPIVGERSGTSDLSRDENGHWWMQCLLCDSRVLSDPFSWGSRAYCVGCWNHFTSRGLFPPVCAFDARRMTDLEWGDWSALD
ncbi:hypothetical protein GCM10009743_63900 [Kribbella swartbergensis]